MAALSRYHWPGNIRELENFIERAVILTRGLEPYRPVGRAQSRVAANPAMLAQLSTLEEAEREHIRRALQQANWLVGGPAGAAATPRYEADDAAVEDGEARHRTPRRPLTARSPQQEIRTSARILFEKNSPGLLIFCSKIRIRWPIRGGTVRSAQSAPAG